MNFVNDDAVVTDDFVESSFVATFPASTGLEASEQFVPVSVNIVNDQLVETNETFTITLSNPVNGMVGQPGWIDSAIVNVIDDDSTYSVLFCI